jgi:cysteinyl-tRNA synthetase
MNSDRPELRLYNTLTRTKEDFAPLDPGNVRMYVCGPTVYDHAHIGNARPAIVFDVLFRLLRHLYGEDHVTYVRNITDVDDKIIERARRDHPGEDLNSAIRKLTESTEAQYHRDMAALGCLDPTFEPRATAHIPGMVTMIQTLLNKGHAYPADGDEGTEILFDTGSMPDYGRLSNRNLDEQMAGARVAVEAHKHNPADFVLWKQSSASQPGWDGAFSFDGKPISILGRPGWHIECSVMSEALLGNEFDIHGGGLDLIFPHHENEIAQSRCAHGNARMAQVFMHNGYLQLEGRKMSKSEGNFVTVNELLTTDNFGGRKWPGDVLRLAMLMTHYRDPIDFSVARLEEAESLVQTAFVGSLRSVPRNTKSEPTTEIEQMLTDDLNTSEISGHISQLAKAGNRNNGDSQRLANVMAFLGIFRDFEKEVSPLLEQSGLSENVNVVGEINKADWLRRSEFDLEAIATVSNNPDLFRYLSPTESWSAAGRMKDVATANVAIEERSAAFSSADYEMADGIRVDLSAQGFKLVDDKDPETGERRTRWEVKR